MAADHVPFSYNGYIFPDHSKTRVDITPVYNSSGRGVKYLRVRLDIETVLLADCASNIPALQTTNATMDALKLALTQPNRRLIFTGLGAGSLSIDTADPRVSSDVIFGPKPQLLSWQPIGYNRAARVRWQCEIHISKCVFELNNVAEYEYTISWNYDDAGMTTRTITGQIEIKNNTRYSRVADVVPQNDGRLRVLASVRPNLIATADVQRIRVLSQFPPVPQFNRRESFTLSEDRRFLQFSITDTEIPSDAPYFPGVSKMNARYQVNNQTKGPGWAQWNVTLSGSIEVGPKVHKSLAYILFVELVRSRIAQSVRIRQGRVGVPVPGEGQTFQSGLLVITNHSVTEELFGRRLDFSLSWIITSRLSDIAQVSDLFGDIPRRDEQGVDRAIKRRWTWEQWAESARQRVRGVGYQNMRHFPRDDLLLSLCDRDANNVVHHQIPQPPRMRRRDVQNAYEYLGNEVNPPDKSLSWVDVKAEVDVMQSTGIAAQRPLREPETKPEPSGSSQASYWDSSSAINQMQEGEQTKDSVVVYNRTSSSYLVRVKGHAIRAAHTIPSPRLVTIGGVTPKLLDKRISMTQIARTNVPIYGMMFDLLYALPRAPTGDLQITDQLLPRKFERL